MAKRLFIGGCADGTTLDVVDGRPWVVPHPLPKMLLHDAGALPNNKALGADHYSPTKLMGHETVFTVYCLEGMAGDEVISSLISGYRRLKRNP